MRTKYLHYRDDLRVKIMLDDTTTIKTIIQIKKRFIFSYWSNVRYTNFEIFQYDKMCFPTSEWHHSSEGFPKYMLHIEYYNPEATNITQRIEEVVKKYFREEEIKFNNAKETLEKL